METDETLVRRLIAELEDTWTYREQLDWGPLNELIGELCRSHGKTVAAFVVACIGEPSPEPGTGPKNALHNTLTWVLSFLPDERWPDVVGLAVEALAADSQNVAADTIIECASYQRPAVLRPYLERLFRINAECGRGWWGIPMFHDARWEDVAFLAENWESYDSATRRFAANALLETRLPQAVRFVTEHDSGDANPLSWVGFASVGDGFRRLYPEQPLHLAFPSAYLDCIYDGMPQFPKGKHPTWVPPGAGDHLHRFGGASDVACGVCGRHGHNLLTLDPVPAGMGVTGLPRLQLATCLSCLGWQRERLSYAHDDSGRVTDLNAAGEVATSEFPAGPLAETRVGLVDLGPRWKWQPWDDRQNLHRLGGHPVWVQPAEYPRCPRCDRLSTFLLQLDSPLVREEDGKYHEWLWGMGGVCYVFWCDACKISTIFWQTT